MQLMASDKATQYPANGFSFRGSTSYLANNNNTQTNNDFSSPVAESSAADRPRAPAARAGGERGSRSTATYNGYVCRDRNCYVVCALGECRPVRGRKHAGW